jgi:DNA gyrase subunit A
VESEGKILPIAIEEEIKGSYLNYAMSVIVSRALPDIRDGLKPVHRRILYSMSEMGLRHDKPNKKCARIVGDVLGKYHPHGDASVYDALVRMAQNFSLRYPLVYGQGNFGSVDGDPPAAMRYTEARLERISEEMVRDINKNTVDFIPNYDDSTTEPAVMPAAIPSLLVNGATGIAVGMATNIPPHNLAEVCAAAAALIDDPGLELEGLLKYISGPDFPTGGLIFGRAGIKSAYQTGRGKILVRAKVSLETSKSGRDVIVVTEIPFGVNKAALVIKINELAETKKIEGISLVRDESDRQGMRVVIFLKRGAVAKVVLNQLFAHTLLQQNFNVNALALVQGAPKIVSLKDMLSCFILHRKEVVTRRTRFDLEKARERAHILEGLKIALENIDEVIAIIKAAKTVEAARIRLIERFSFSEKQAQAILDMRLQRLTSMETQKILDELKEILALIEYLESLLADETKLMGVIKAEITEIGEKYGDPRRTEIIASEVEKIDVEDMITREDMVVLVSHKGFIKRVPANAYKNQGRGGKGSSSTNLVNEDFLEHLFIASTHDYLLFITSEGKAYWVKVHEIPEGSRTSRGVQVKTLLSISANEEITATVSLSNFSGDRTLLMITRKGVIKKVSTEEFANAKTRGIIALRLDNGDHLVSALITSGRDEVVLVSKFGYALRMSEETIRTMGRATRGVSGMKLQERDEISGVMAVHENEEMVLVTECGHGKRIRFEHFTCHGRGTQGQIIYRITEKTGELTAALSANIQDDVVCITSQGNTLKLKLADIPQLGKTAQGVRIVNIEKPDFLVGAARIINEKD